MTMEKLLRRVYESKRLSVFLKTVSHIATAVSVMAFAFLAVVAFLKSPLSLLKLAVITGVPFVAVTVIRKLINAPRPYELYEFYSTLPKERCGSSFPSRHSFSAFAIGTALCFVYPIIGATVLVFGLLMCASRVLLGIHFIRDVVCGALIGVGTSVIGMMIMSPF